MTLHLVKLCVGVESVDHLRRLQSDRLKAMKAAGDPQQLFHRTFQMPKRRDELLDGGSLYWVIKGAIQARQPLADLSEGRKDNGSRLLCDLSEAKADAGAAASASGISRLAISLCRRCAGGPGRW